MWLPPSMPRLPKMPADEAHHINKHDFKIPFVCGCRNLGEALRRIGEGAAMIRTKGEAGTGDVVEAVRHARSVLGAIKQLQTMPDEELMSFAKNLGAPFKAISPNTLVFCGGLAWKQCLCDCRKNSPI